MQLLSFLQKGVVLRQSLQRQLVCYFDVLGSGDVSLLEVTNFYWISRTKQANLSLFCHQLNNLLDNILELSGDQPVDFIQNDQLALVKLSLSSLGQIQYSSWSGNDNMHCLVETDYILVDSRATR